MARYLAIDWTANQICVVSATTGKGGARVQRAVIFPEASPLGGPDVEAVGQRLRDHLKAAKIGAAPVVACLGRDRVVVKDIRFPAGIPENEEPGVVRFQALKELTNSPDEVVVDYARLGDSGAERRALVLAARRDQVAAYQALCKAAGLKLAAISARPFGLTACLERNLGTSVLTPPPDPPGSPVAVVAVGEGWAEFVVGRNGTPLLSRSLQPGPALAAEVRRNLMVYSGQAAGQAVKAVYVCGGADSAAFRERLRQTLDVPVHLVDPFAGSEQPDLPVPDRRGPFVGLVGLLHLRSDRKGLPCDFLAPKQPRAAEDPNKRRGLLLVLLAASLLLALGTLAYLQMSRLSKQIASQAYKNTELDKQLKQAQDDAKRAKALNDWNDHNVPVLEELYELAERWPDPDQSQTRLSSLTFEVVERPPNSKDATVAKMSLKGVTGNDYGPVDQMMRRWGQDKYYKPDSLERGRNTGPDVRNGYTQQFTVKRVDILKRPPDKYTSHIDESAAQEKGRGRGRR